MVWIEETRGGIEVLLPELGEVSKPFAPSVSGSHRGRKDCVKTLNLLMQGLGLRVQFLLVLMRRSGLSVGVAPPNLGRFSDFGLEAAGVNLDHFSRAIREFCVKKRVRSLSVEKCIRVIQGMKGGETCFSSARVCTWTSGEPCSTRLRCPCPPLCSRGRTGSHIQQTYSLWRSVCFRPCHRCHRMAAGLSFF